MAETVRVGSEVSLVADALVRMTDSLTQCLTQSLEGVQEVARQEAQNSERRLQEALRRAEERFQEALRESEERVVARSAPQCRESNPPSIEEEIRALKTENNELKRQMQNLEVSINTALERVFPRVERLVQQLEERPPSLPPASSNANRALLSDTGLSTTSNPKPIPSSSNRRLCPCRSAPANTTAALSVDNDSEWSRGTALRDAAHRGQLQVVRRLLDEGADINFSNISFWSPRPTAASTPLHVAAHSAHADVVSLLLERGADLDEVSWDSNTALHLAAQNDTAGLCVQVLIAAGADVNKRNCDGRTPLHCAAAGGRDRAARVLLAAGASKTATDRSGHLPYCLVPLYFPDILRP